MHKHFWGLFCPPKVLNFLFHYFFSYAFFPLLVIMVLAHLLLRVLWEKVKLSWARMHRERTLYGLEVQ